MSPKRPSPILLPEGSEPAKGGKILEWVRRILGRPASTGAHIDAESERIEDQTSVGRFEGPSPQRATIQLLPGRLESLTPEVIEQEVRFQRGSAETQEVTLGWEIGDPPNHVTLDHPSIQPLHAKMTYQEGRWMIESVAAGDPIEVNGTPVPSTSGPYLLAAGDEIRIGEALFRFHLP